MRELTIPTGRAQLYGLLVFILGAPCLLAPYALIWGLHLPQQSTSQGSLIFGLSVVVGIVLHEFIHGLTAVWYGGVAWSKTKFGVQWKSLTPYFHSTVPLPVSVYRVVVVMPLVILGLLPYLLALLGGNFFLLAVGLFFTLAAGGDVMILWLMRSLGADELVQDHPTKVGLLLADVK